VPGTEPVPGVEQTTAHEVAATLGCSVSFVRDRLATARTVLDVRVWWRPRGSARCAGGRSAGWPRLWRGWGPAHVPRWIADWLLEALHDCGGPDGVTDDRLRERFAAHLAGYVGTLPPTSTVEPARGVVAAGAAPPVRHRPEPVTARFSRTARR